MTKLADKRVGIIGTGATVIQCVPPLARAAEQLFVFQRTPSSVDYRGNAQTDPVWSASLTPGWQQRKMENFTKQMAGIFDEEDAIGDGWTVLAPAVRGKLMADPSMTPRFMEVLEHADFEKMVKVRARMEELVEDKATAQALQPWFSLFCKRPCFHDDYLDIFNRPNVKLVDTEGRGVERIPEMPSSSTVANTRSTA
jgi:cyclohexanone monooxygenase